MEDSGGHWRTLDLGGSASAGLGLGPPISQRPALSGLALQVPRCDSGSGTSAKQSPHVTKRKGELHGIARMALKTCVSMFLGFV